MTVKPCNRLAVGGHRSRQMQFIDFFYFNMYFASSAFPSSAEADVE